MSNLESAKAAIKAELSHAREGLDFYQSRIEALEKALSQLASVSGAGNGVSTTGKSGRKSTADSGIKVKMQKRGSNDAGERLPFTGGDFWPNLMTDKPQSVSEILQAAIAKLGVSPTPEQNKKLSGRMTFALNTLVKAKRIQDSGSGRERRFFMK